MTPRASHKTLNIQFTNWLGSTNTLEDYFTWPTEMEMWPSQLHLQFKQLHILINPQNIFRASTGFEPMASVLAQQCFTNWAMKTHKLGGDQFIEFIFTRNRNETWNEVDLIWSTTATIISLFHLYSHSSNRLHFTSIFHSDTGLLQAFLWECHRYVVLRPLLWLQKFEIRIPYFSYWYRYIALTYRPLQPTWPAATKFVSGTSNSGIIFSKYHLKLLHFNFFLRASLSLTSSCFFRFRSKRML